MVDATRINAVSSALPIKVSGVLCLIDDVKRMLYMLSFFPLLYPFERAGANF